MNPDPLLSGTRIRRLRDNLGLSQSALADRLGIATARVPHYETGRRALPIDIAITLGKLGKVSIDWLYGYTNRRKG